MVVKTRSNLINFLETEFSKNMDVFVPFEKKPKIGVAVSGGSDSLALILLAKNWVKKFGGSVIGITVDHSLRNSSFEEALSVERQLKKLDIQHKIIKYQGLIPKSRIQEVARNYRYKLLSEFCENNNIFHLLVGHHSLDQRETCLMRSWRDSGFIGMAGMSAIREFNSYRLLRPLLNFDHNDLKNYLLEKKITWIEDQTNKNNFFLRVKARKYLAGKNWSIDKLYAEKRIKFEKAISKFFALNAEVNDLGFVRFNLKQFLKLNRDFRQQILSRSIITVAGLEYSPSMRGLKRVSEHFTRFSNSKTLGGCLLIKKKGNLFCVREIRNIDPKQIEIDAESLLWDRRFKIKMTKSREKQLKLQRLGRKGFDQVTNAGYYNHCSNIPKVALLSLPALWDKDKVISIPNLGVSLYRDLDVTATFAPIQSLSPLGFAVVN
ncbi:MAG: tRNA(Ile)-lysidine synthase [Alphaproteobacteria bacterium MarineAlpha2_Bin1]|nr:MAG: tRNA(Ile)-lysidine synthase [Alphaproteobacteria bacterium MarineAlpha2_Bin1]